MTTRPIDLDDRPLTGGPLAIDLLNTRWRQGAEVVDWLDRPGATLAFAAEHGRVIEPRDLAAATTALARARDLIGRLFDSARADAITTEVADEVDAVIARARPSLHVDGERPRLTVTPPPGPDAVATEAVLDAITLLEAGPNRIRSCEHDDCVLWFHDSSRSGRRRWCSMERCGNRAKAKRHYDRTTRSA